MYRHSTNNSVTYTPDDIVLFRESPFAAWMERLTLENPRHGIPPDASAPTCTESSRANLAITLGVDGRNVVVIDPEMQESDRTTATLEAMRAGADFIANGQLTVDALSATPHFLMRTSGYSDLGAFLYIPCETQAESSLNSGFRLSFVAELLHVLQGQLPPQMLIIRESADVVPLLTEDYIYYYRSVQQRFLKAMESFRKHRMPDPAESSHFGRWSVCASEMFKQRARRERQKVEQPEIDEQPSEEAFEMPQQAVANANATAYSVYDNAAARQHDAGAQESNRSTTVVRNTLRSEAHTHLAEQIMHDHNGADATPTLTPDLAPLSWARTVEATSPLENTDAALHNLEFIGSSGPHAAGFLADGETGQSERRKHNFIDDDHMEFSPVVADSLIDMDDVSAPLGEPLGDAEDAAVEVVVSASLRNTQQQVQCEPLKPVSRPFSNSLLTSEESDAY
ncbi:MAG: hypothetical protein P8J79_06355 [Halioglobus sp.]|nr:hypothetical protein [Halioglobus sp.]